MSKTGLTVLNIFFSIFFGIFTSLAATAISGKIYYLFNPCYGEDCWGALAFAFYGLFAIPIFIVLYAYCLQKTNLTRTISLTVGVASIFIFFLLALFPNN